MKNLFLVTFLILSFTGFSQSIKPAPSDKSIVYFVRPSSLGFAINFTYCDSTKVIGRFNGPKYIRYECEPGEHIFWARSENKDFVKANLAAGEIYFIEAVPKMGAIKAGVRLVPLDPKVRDMKKILKLIGKKESESFTDVELKGIEKELSKMITTGLKKYQSILSKGKGVKLLSSDMNY